MNIIIDRLRKEYKDVVAVDDISLEIKSGELFSLLGLNGAGKTTLIKMLSTLTKPTSGFAFIDGIVLKKCVGVESTYYDSSYDGSVNELTYSCIIGGKSVYMFFVIIDNDNGQGIYSFGMED